MNKVFTLIIFLLTVLMFSGCALVPPANSGNGLDPQLPTPTSHLYFNNNQEIILLEPVGENDEVAVPTVAPHFSNLPTSVPDPRPVLQSPARNSPSNLQEEAFLTKPIYDDVLNSDWRLLRSATMDVNIVSSGVQHQGDYSIEMNPRSGYNLLYFTVNRESREQYLRDRVLGINFWLYSGEEILELDDLAVSVVGSNAYPHWIPDDDSVTSDITPAFSETRLYYLGLNRSIPPDNWVYVELLLDNQIYDPDYKYVTGFYIKSDKEFTQTIHVDEVNVMMLEEDRQRNPRATITPTVADPYLPVLVVHVDAERDVHSISPLIYGISDANPEYMEAMRPTLSSWGGNPSTRYNWKIGHAWNAGRDWEFRNGNYGYTSGSVSDGFIQVAMDAGADVRLALPTLGWVAKNDDENTCSFPMPNGECNDGRGATCEIPFLTTDPNRANIPTDTEFVADWLRHLVDEMGFDLRFLAMDNEPELWGYTHYDVHPTCTTYQEILSKFLEYAVVAKEIVPEAEVTGPVTCCWYYYFNSAAGAGDKEKHGDQDFLPWFLDSVRTHDEENDLRTLDVLDIHFYPGGVYNQKVDKETAALRLRSTRSLWDPTYVEETGIGHAVQLIPRMKQMIEEHYPGTKLGISEWNWGADTTMNGALAIADVLGAFGREDLYFANYWVAPPIDSPGFYAFKMYTNYDNRGSRFGDTSVWSQSSDVDTVSSYTAIDSDTGNLHLMLVNKLPGDETSTIVNLGNFQPKSRAMLYRLDQTQPDSIAKDIFQGASNNFQITLPAYSITLLVLESE